MNTNGVAVVAFALDLLELVVGDRCRRDARAQLALLRPPGSTIGGFIQSLPSVRASAGLVFLTMVWLSQSSKRVGAIHASSPGIRERSSSVAPK